MAASKEEAVVTTDEPPAKKARPSGKPAAESAKKRAPGQQGGLGLTLQEIATDKVTKLAQANWSNAALSKAEKPHFSNDLVVSIYAEELRGDGDKAPGFKRVMLLEISQYLENYLWPNFQADTASFEHVMSIVFMVNEKFRENIPAWTCFHTREDAFPGLFKRILGLKDEHQDLKTHERTAYLMFAINMFQSLEDEMVRGQVLRLVSLPLWHALSPAGCSLELHAHEALAKHWKAAAKKESKAAAKAAKEGGGGYVAVVQRPEVRFLPGLLDEFLEVLQEKVSAYVV